MSCKVTIDGTEVSVAENSTILFAAASASVEIPTLCWMHDINEVGACRVCVVEVEGQNSLVAACNTQVTDGMVVRTNTPRVVNARRANVETMLQAHRSECTTCVRSAACALQELANNLGAKDGMERGRAQFAERTRSRALEARPLQSPPPPPPRPQKPAWRMQPWSPTFALQRDASKCIRCWRCVAVCDKVQHASVWEIAGPAANRSVQINAGERIENVGCALCGQCITHCPTAALTARDDTLTVMDALADPDVITVAQVAPAIVSAWGEGVGVPTENANEARLVSAIKALGFDYVYNTNFTADLTIMEEASEFIEWLKEGKPKPMFTSCCPGWVRFARQHYPQFISQLSTSKSPHEMLGAVAKHMFEQGKLFNSSNNGATNSGENADNPAGKKLFIVSIMPCVAKKYEAATTALSQNGEQNVDAVLTTREFCRMLRAFDVNCASLEEQEFDAPLGLASGAGVIFGRTGGVMEAALRSAHWLISGENPSVQACDTTAATPYKPWVEKAVDVCGTTVNIAIASGLENTSKLLDAIEAGSVSYDFVEIMACPGGCVGGGGQPIQFNRELAAVRAETLNKNDAAGTLRFSHENPAIKQLYETVLGKPLSPLAEGLLHTNQQQWEL